jgi:hypothetical protein
MRTASCWVITHQVVIISYAQPKHAGIKVNIGFCTREKLLVFHRVPPQVADRAMLARYGGYRGNKILGADQNQYRCPAVYRVICKG